MLCVACYYSNRYNNSDSFLNDRTDDVEFQNFVMKISLCRPEKIVREFADAYLIAYGNHTPKESLTPQDEYFLQNHFHPGEDKIEELSGQEMQYLWNDFLLSRKYPPQMYSNMYKKILSESIFDGHYNEESDIFKKLGSSQLPLIHKFLQFWDETIMEDTSEYAELEIDEYSSDKHKIIKLIGEQRDINYAKSELDKKKDNLSSKNEPRQLVSYAGLSMYDAGFVGSNEYDPWESDFGSMQKGPFGSMQTGSFGTMSG